MSYKMTIFRFTRTASCHDLRPDAESRARLRRCMAYAMRHHTIGQRSAY